MTARRARNGQHTRSDRKIGSRLALAAVALAAGIFCATTGIANAVQRTDASAAYALAPWNGVVETAFANQLFTENPMRAAPSRASELAGSALMKDATSARALTVLGFQAELARDIELRDRIFAYSTRLSRRELRSQLWAAENAISQGDIVKALHHYDIALRTSGTARTLLFPTLTNALSEPLIRRHLLELLKTNPNWAPLFVNHASMTGPDFVAIADFFRAGRAIGLPLDDNMRASVVNGLLAQGQIEPAWAYYASFRPAVRRDRSRDFDFVHVADVRSGFDWVPGTQPGVSAALLKTGNGGLLDFALASGTGGTVVSQRQMLPPGSYRLRGHSTPSDLPEASRPQWTITCDNGAEILRLDLPGGTGELVSFSRDFVVPEACRRQTLLLVARATDAIGGIAGQIQDAAIEPVNAGARQ